MQSNGAGNGNGNQRGMGSKVPIALDSSKGKNGTVAGGMSTTEPPKNATEIESRNLGIQAKQTKLAQTAGDHRMITAELPEAENLTTQSNIALTTGETTEAHHIGADRRHPSGDSGIGDEMTGPELMDVHMPPAESRMNLNGTSASNTGPNTQTAHQQNKQPVVQFPDEPSFEQERQKLVKHCEIRRDQENRRMWERRLAAAGLMGSRVKRRMPVPNPNNTKCQRDKPSGTAPKAPSRAWKHALAAGWSQTPKDPKTVKSHKQQHQSVVGQILVPARGPSKFAGAGKKRVEKSVSSPVKAQRNLPLDEQHIGRDSEAQQTKTHSSTGGVEILAKSGVSRLREGKKTLETVEIPPQNVTSLQEHQQKVIEADVVQSEAPALTPAATQNLIIEQVDNVAELKKQLKDANDALEQCRIDTETLNAYRSANDNLHEIQETLEKSCSRMETEIAELPGLRKELQDTMAALEQSRNESADHRSEIDRLQRELAMSAEEHKRVEWNSARTIAELGRELHSTKERVMEQREKKENYKEHLRKMIKEKEDNDKRRSAETDEAVQELERKLEAQKAVQASVDARLESRNKEIDRLNSKLRVKKAEKAELRKAVEAWEKHSADKEATWTQNLTAKELRIRDLEQELELWKAKANQIEDANVVELHQGAETGVGEGDYLTRPAPQMSEMGQSSAAESGYHSMPSELNGDDRTTLMAGESERAPQQTIVNELRTTTFNNDDLDGVEALLQLSSGTITDSGNQPQFVRQEDQFNAPDEEGNRQNFVPPSLEKKKSSFKFNLAQVLAQNLPDKTIGSAVDSYEFRSTQSTATTSKARVGAISRGRGTRAWGSEVNRSPRRKRTFGPIMGDGAPPPKMSKAQN